MSKPSQGLKRPLWKIRPDESEDGLPPDVARQIKKFKAIHDHQRVVLAEVTKMFPELAHGESGASIGYEDLFKLLDKTEKNIVGEALRYRRNYLASNLARGNEQLGWKVPVPPLIAYVRRAPSPWLPRNFRMLPRVRAWQLASRHALGSGRQEFLERSIEKQPRIRLGEILFSAMLDSAMLNAADLGILARALLEPPDSGLILIHEDLMWMEGFASEKHTYRRFFMLPETRSLILQWFKDGLWNDARNAYQRGTKNLERPFTTAQVFTAIQSYLKKLSLHARGIPGSFSQLVWPISTLHSIALPGFLLHHASSVASATSLPLSVFLRLHCDSMPDEIGAKESVTGSPVPDQLARGTNSPQDSEKYQPELLTELGRCLYVRRGLPVSRQAAVVNLREFIQRHAAQGGWLSALAEYAEYLVHQRRASPRSAYEYIHAIATTLLRAASAQPLVKPNSGVACAELYRQVVDAGNTVSVRQTRARRLLDFHDFLVREHGASAIDPSAFPEAGKQRQRSVSANLITPLEFERIKRAIRHVWGEDSPDGTVALVMVILAYRGGMREMEVLRLLIREVVGGQKPQIIVAENELGGVKSKSSVRRLPMHRLPPPDELRIIVEWITDRVGNADLRRILDEQDIELEDLPFCSTAGVRTVRDGDRIMRTLDRIIKSVTGDPAVRFHHLRHSFINFTLLALLREDLPNVDQIFPKPSLPWAVSRRSLLGHDQPTISLLHLVSQLAGHSDAGVTVTSYSHLFDWYLYQALLCSNKLDESRLFSKWRSWQDGYARVITSRARASGKSPTRALLDAAFGKKLLESMSVAVVPRSSNGSVDVASPEQIGAWSMLETLRRHFEDGISSEILAAESGWDEQAISAWINEARVWRTHPWFVSLSAKPVEAEADDSGMAVSHRSKFWISRPRSAVECQFCAERFERVIALASGSQPDEVKKTEEIRWLIDKVWQGTDRWSRLVLLEDEGTFDRYLRGLELLDIRRARRVLIFKPAANAVKREVGDQTAYWRRRRSRVVTDIYPWHRSAGNEWGENGAPSVVVTSKINREANQVEAARKRRFEPSNGYSVLVVLLACYLSRDIGQQV